MPSDPRSLPVLAMTQDRRLVYVEDGTADLARILVLETMRYELHRRDRLTPVGVPAR